MKGPVKRLSEQLPSPWAEIVDWVLGLLIFAVFVGCVYQWVIRPYRIPSASMEPTLQCAMPGPGCSARWGDRILVAPIVFRFRGPTRGEIVAFHAPAATPEYCGGGEVLVKRVLGIPGDSVVEKDGVVFVNGLKWNEPYIKNDRRDKLTGRWKVPADEYFMMGDNRARSCDSRSWGPVPRADLIGPVFAVYWPPRRISLR